MTKDEFVKTCVICGYASKKNAIKYATDKDVLTNADFEVIHRINERQNDIKYGVLEHNHGTHSGEYLLNNLAKNPEPWNHIFDASRGVKR